MEAIILYIGEKEQHVIGYTNDTNDAVNICMKVNNQITSLKQIDKEYCSKYDAALAQYRSHVKLGTPKPTENTMDDAINWRLQKVAAYRNVCSNLPELVNGQFDEAKVSYLELKKLAV